MSVAPGEAEGRDFEAAMVAAVGALRRRERSVAELHEWLRGRELHADVIDAVIAELLAVGELDDDRFACGFAADKRDLAGWGPERIEAVLIDRGIERALAEAAAREDHELQLDRAAEQVRRRFGPLTGDAERARALAFLGRRGYGYEIAYDAIRRAERDAA